MPDLRRRKKADYSHHASKGDKQRLDPGKAAIRRTWLIFAAVLLSVIVVPVIVLFVIPSPIDAQEIRTAELPVLEGRLAPNDFLQKAEHVYENQIIGPESLVAYGEDLFTGTSDGRILRLRNGETSVLAKLGKDPCGGAEYEESCGRPLGMRMDKSGFLYICDAYLGLYRVDTANGQVKVLWPASAPIGGKQPRFLNDLDVTSDGKVYFTDSSTKWRRKDFAMCVLEAESTGRLIEYDQERNTTRVLMTGLAFANGVQLSKSGDFILVVECTVSRIWKYHLKGPRQDEYEVFADNLPGLPDNIRSSSTGGYWVSFATVKHRHKFSLLHFVSDKPWLRNILSKLGTSFITSVVPKYGLIIELDEGGGIRRSLHDPSGQIVPSVSEVEDTGSVLYLGSYNQPYLSKLAL